MAKVPKKKRLSPRIQGAKPWHFFFLGAVLAAAVLTIAAIGAKLMPSPLLAPTTALPVTAPAVVVASTSAKQPPPNKQTTGHPTNTPLPPSSPSGSNGVPILMYHYVGNNPNSADRQRDVLSITPDKLDAQFAWLVQNGYTPITLDTLYGLFAKKENISKPIVLTFDDGYVDFYFNAWPILRKYNFHAVSFIPTGLVGKTYYMSWDQIKEINNSGLVSFAAHTVSHAYLPSLSYSNIQSELATSKKTLEQQLGTRVNFVAYPYGASDTNVWRAAQEAGFVGGAGTWYGRATGPGINMPRIRIAGTITLAEFAQKVVN